MKRTLAVHFGPGRLGLGLVVDVLLNSERFDVYLVGRPDPDIPEQPTYFLRFTDPTLGLRERRVVWAGNPGDVDDLPDSLIDRLSSDQPALFTAALGADNITEAKPRIAGMLELRPPVAPTALLACENEPDPIYDELEKAFPRVVVRRCVVDRICSWDSRGAVESGRWILAHDVGQIVVPHASGQLFDGLRKEPEVVLLTGAADAHRDRKMWVVNGLHLVLATIARRAGVDLLPLTDARARAFREHAKPLTMAMLETVKIMHGLDVDEHFAEERVRGFCEAPDSASRILAKRYLRADLRPFVERLDKRLSSCARAAKKCDVDLDPFLWAFREVEVALREPDSFLDVSAVDPATGRLRRCKKPPAINPAIDKEVEEMFTEALDWAPAEEAARLCRRVHAALATWRDN